jgi:hypothetical protein
MSFPGSLLQGEDMATLSFIGYDRQRQESFTPSPASAVSPMHRLTGAFDAEPQDDQPDHGREEAWEQRLRSLQEWICELLIKNQQLRMLLLASSTNRQSVEGQLMNADSSSGCIV